MSAENEYAIIYSYSHGPGAPQDLRPSFLLVNCQAYGHLVLREKFNIALPSDMLSLELFQDETRVVRTLEPSIPPQAGDIYLFGAQGVTDMRTLHWAIHTGRLINGEPLLGHANQFTKSVGFWKLSRFESYTPYRQLVRIKRPIALWTASP